jgi:hypothetical protein
MIQGFPLQSTIFPGDTLTLHVSTDAPQFRVDLYRQGSSLELMFSSDWFAAPGINFPDHEADADWTQDQTEADGLKQAWPPFDISIPASFATGVYIAMFVEGDGNGQPRGNNPPLVTTTADARFGKTLFVVRNPAPGVCAKILYKLPFFTYHAYCDVGGWALYTPPDSETIAEGEKPAFVSLRRPGGGTGGHPWDDWNFDPADLSSARQVFAHWDAPFIAWLERNGYAIDYATDLDLHTDPNLLAPYSLVLSVGHDEYWSKEMRDQAEAFIQQGGNFAFFSGNTCWWVVDLTNGFLLRRTGNWWDSAGRPENSLTGVSFRNGWEGNQDRPKFGYIVQNHDHWLFAGTGINGTGLQEGDRFGFGEQLVGYEADGANFDRSQGPPFIPKLDDGTPSSFVILGVGDANQFAGGGNNNGAATMGVYTNGGTVFTGATTDWPRVVALNGEPNTVQITYNVLNGLSGYQMVDVTAISGTWLSPGAPLTSWQTPNGPFLVEHVAGVDDAGNVIVFFWSPQADWQAVSVSAICGRTLLPGALLTSWQTPDGPYTVEHLAGVDADGKVVVFFWSPRADWQAVEVSDISGQTLAPDAPLTSWQTPDGPYLVEHLGGVDGNGNVFVFFWSPRADWQVVDVTSISGQSLTGGAALTSWQTPDGPYNVEHLAGSDAAGNVFVFFWSPRADWQTVDVTSISGQSLTGGAALTSWQTPDGPYNVEHLAGSDAAGNVFVFFWSPRADWQAVNVSAIAAQFLAGAAPLTSWQISKDAPRGSLLAEKLAGVGVDRSLIVYSWTSVRDWCALDLSLYTGVTAFGWPTSWKVPDGARTVEHLASTTADGRVIVSYWE